MPLVLHSKIKPLILLLFLTATLSSQADVKLTDLIDDNMVLQRTAKVRIWGTADSGEEVTLLFRDQSLKATADNKGSWQVELSPMTPGGPFEMTITGKNTIKLHNILVGDVWLASGQSNMALPVKLASTAKREISQKFDSEIHLYRVRRIGTAARLTDPGGKWVICTPETVANFSAVGYIFAKEIHQSVDVPIGIIQSAYGATYVECWTSRQLIEADPDLKPIINRWNRVVSNFQKLKVAYLKQYAKWKQIDIQAKARGESGPQKPAPPQPDPSVNPWRPGGLYNAMVYPLANYCIKGVIWYQGEQNADRSYQYRKLFPLMIKNWRNTWRINNLPFIFVQLANFNNFKKPTTTPGPSTWAELREAQAKALSIPNTAMAVTIDIGDPNSIHPKDKEDVAKRLALAAEALVYGKKIVFSGPIYDSISIEEDKIRIKFKFSKYGLMTRNNEPPKGFAIAGSDRKFVWAQAKIDGQTILVWSKQVPKPLAVRYAWADNPVCNLYNKARLPGAPFRTDDWPCVTANNR
ncbi:MAG: sialate O-acetylesterase [Phycisphaerae bacterium]